jgi:hypothetical protein
MFIIVLILSVVFSSTLLTTGRMEHIEKLIELGTQLGYKGEQLQKYVDTQTVKLETRESQDLDREERAAKRQAEK